jgi:glycerol uptake facilitator-like aquaporin
MEPQLGLNLGGWIFIAVAWGCIWTVAIFCFKRVLGAQGKKK